MKTLKHTIISGSTRPNSQSKKVGHYISTVLATHVGTDSVHFVDLAVDTFPLWDEAVWSKGTEWHPTWAEISKKLQNADAITIVSPEWNGMVPPQLMNLFQLCSNDELSHKPALIVSVSSGNGGAYPISELRLNSFKNTKICYIPEQVIVRDVENVLNEMESDNNESDQYIRDRMQHALSLLNLYAGAFTHIREHEAVKNSQFPYGM